MISTAHQIFGADGRVSPSRLLTEPEYFAGLDLGKTQDHTALALIERVHVVHRDARDAVTQDYGRETRHFVRHLQRVPLLTPYPDIVALVKRMMEDSRLARRSTLVVDATGVGAPVVDLLQQAGLPCLVVPVTITGGGAESSEGGVWRVPKRDLIMGLKVAFQKRWLEVGRGPATEALRAELSASRMRVSTNGHEVFGAGSGHDDLVMVVALAWWRVRRCWPGRVQERLV